MNVYIVPTQAIPRGFDELETGSRGGGNRKLSASDSRQPGASWKWLLPGSGHQALHGSVGSLNPLWLHTQHLGRPQDGCSELLSWNGSPGMSIAILWLAKILV